MCISTTYQHTVSSSLAQRISCFVVATHTQKNRDRSIADNGKWCPHILWLSGSRHCVCECVYINMRTRGHIPETCPSRNGCTRVLLATTTLRTSTGMCRVVPCIVEICFCTKMRLIFYEFSHMIMRLSFSRQLNNKVSCYMSNYFSTSHRKSITFHGIFIALVFT